MASQKVPFERGGDSGQNDADSVQPIGGTEFVEPDVQGRPIENLRVRTETLRREAEDGKYIHDYDRALLLRSNAIFTLTETSPGSEKYTLSADQDLWVYPALTPGRESGGRWSGARLFVGEQPYAGTDMVNALILTATRYGTGQRGYADGDIMEGAVLSLGANRLMVRIVADPTLAAGQVRYTIEGSPRSRVTISHGSLGGATTVTQLAMAISTDTTAFGLYGMSHLMHATVGAGSTSTSPAPTCGWSEFRGGHDAEAHQITSGQLDAFFGIEDNALGEGHGLAISYVSGLVATGDSAPIGGRRQSIWDLPTDRSGGFVQATTSATGYLLFNTDREPEKIPGAIPIAKMIEGRLVFVDGTIVRPGLPVYLGDSTRTIDRFAATGGAALVGYEGSLPHNMYTLDDTTTLRVLPAGTVEAALDSVVENFGRRTLNDAGSQRVGSHELTGLPTVGNRVLSLAAGSLRQQLIELLNKIDGDGRVLGINGRVQENGHRMRGPDPLHKPFYDAGFSGPGGVFLQSELHAPTNMMAVTPAGTEEFASLSFQPIVYSNPGDADDVLPLLNYITGSTAVSVIFSSMTLAQFAKVFGKMPLVVPTSTPGQPIVPLLYARLASSLGAADAADGYYCITAYNTATGAVTLKKLDGTDPDFTGLGAGATLTLMSVVAVGNDYRYARLRAMLRSDLAEDIAGLAPWAVFGASRKEAVLADTYVASGQLGLRMMRLFADHVDFLGFNPDAPATPISRNSHNILVAQDKALLDGVETGTPVDATASHHHNTAYSALGHNHDATYASITHHHSDTYSKFNPINPVVEVYPLLDILTTAVGTPFTAPTTLGEATVGVLICYELYLTATTPGSPIYTRLEFHEAGSTTPQGVVVAEHSTNSTVIVYGQITVPVFGGGFNVTRAATTNCALGSALTITYTVLHTYTTL